MESLCSDFFKIDRIHYFDIRHFLFDIRFSRVSFSIRPAIFLPAAGLNAGPPPAENLQLVIVPTINETGTRLCFRSAAPSGVPTDF
jgi:hypothetical protein